MLDALSLGLGCCVEPAAARRMEGPRATSLQRPPELIRVRFKKKSALVTPVSGADDSSTTSVTITDQCVQAMLEKLSYPFKQ